MDIKVRMQATKPGARSITPWRVEKFVKGQEYELNESLANSFISSGVAELVDETSTEQKDAGGASDNKDAKGASEDKGTKEKSTRSSRRR